MMAAALDMAGATVPGPLADRRMLYCIGTQRAGTSWLHAMFRGNPALHVPALKEVHYWDTIRSPHAGFYRRKAGPDLDWYRRASLVSRVRKYHWTALVEGAAVERLLAARVDVLGGDGTRHDGYAAMLLDGSRPGQVVVDNTPCYARLGRETFAEMAALAGDARFLFVMRDPVARLWSGIQHRCKTAVAAGTMGADEMVARFGEAVARPRSPDVARSDYRRTIEALEAVIAPSRIHYAFFETMFSQGEYDRICGFLEVPRQRVRTWRRVNRATRPALRPDAAALAAARERLAPVYDFVRSRFGDEVPAEWRP